jgi:NAD(P)H-hydrate repair Nnr-like enzyme with NAD(P)H-hydrate epimerase domain
LGIAADPSSFWPGPATKAATPCRGAPSARELLRRGGRLCGRPAKLPADAADAYRAFIDGGGSTVAEVPPKWRGALIVDGLFGIGLARPLSERYAAQVEFANASGIPILALDIPSGIDADTGVAHGPGHPCECNGDVHRVEARVAHR